jgi:hypothetical protein
VKLFAIYCVWDEYELLRISCDNLRPCVDGIIVIYSELSNFGEVSKLEPGSLPGYVHGFNWEPHNYMYTQTMKLETEKRNYGLQKAREMGATHFICMDADEFYNPIEFNREKERFNNEPDLQGLVCELQTYFRSPTLTIGKDTTRVPFIHKLTPQIQHTFNKRYPFAWVGDEIRIDPTRSLNINSGVKMSTATMHHYSYVREDFGRKIRNSTARDNIKVDILRKDLLQAKDGYYCVFYEKVLHRVPNYFKIPDYDVKI